MTDTVLQTEPVPSPAERRIARRFPLRLECSYRVFERNRLVSSGIATTANISSAGLLLETMDLPDVGLHVEMSLRWPAGTMFRTLEARGRILRVGRSGVAIRVLRYDFKPGFPHEASS